VSISRILETPPTGHTEETALHRAISYHLAHARMPALRHHARTSIRPVPFSAPPRQFSLQLRVMRPLAEPTPSAA